MWIPLVILNVFTAIVWFVGWKVGGTHEGICFAGFTVPFTLLGFGFWVTDLVELRRAMWRQAFGLAWVAIGEHAARVSGNHGRF